MNKIYLKYSEKAKDLIKFFEQIMPTITRGTPDASVRTNEIKPKGLSNVNLRPPKLVKPRVVVACGGVKKTKRDRWWIGIFGSARVSRA